MGVMPIGKLLMSMSVPMMISMLVQALYNVVDSMFVARLNESALTAVSLAFPVQNLMIAVGTGTGVGINALVSRSLGEKDTEHANSAANNGIYLSIFSFMAFAFLTGVFGPLFFKVQTDNAQIISYGVSYVRIIGIMSFGMYMQFVGEKLLQSTGKTVYSMLTQILGAVINIILDPIFIFVLKMGVRGAAFATILSQAASAVWVVRFLTSKKSVVRIRKDYVRLDGRMIRHIAALGISPFIMQSTESLVMITLNSRLKIYGGDLYVGSMSILTSVMQLISVPVQGLNQGMQPIISYNYGAGNKERVLGTFKRMVTICLTVTLVMSGIAILHPQVFSGLFTNKEELLTVTNQVMPVYFLGTTLFGIQMACQTTFIALGQAKASLFIALLRKVILLIPLAMILPRFFGVMGVYYAEPVADILSVLTTIVLFTITIRKVLKNWETNETR